VWFHLLKALLEIVFLIETFGNKFLESFFLGVWLKVIVAIAVIAVLIIG